MQIRCKVAPQTFAWSDPKKRFFFHTKEWRNSNDTEIRIFKKKLKEKFNDVFEVRDGPVYQQVTEEVPKKGRKRKFL